MLLESRYIYSIYTLGISCPPSWQSVAGVWLLTWAATTAALHWTQAIKSQ